MFKHHLSIPSKPAQQAVGPATLCKSLYSVFSCELTKIPGEHKFWWPPSYEQQQWLNLMCEKIECDIAFT